MDKRNKNRILLTSADIPELKLKIDQKIKEFETENIFIPGTTNSSAYVGYLLTVLYNEFFKPEEYKKGMPNTIIDLNDLNLIKELWNIYRVISLKYGSAATLQRYCAFTGISFETVTTWKNGEYRTAEYSETIKGFLNESEADIYSRAIDSNSIGAIFALKAGFGYNDQSPQQINISRVDAPTLTQEEISKQLSILSDDE